VNVEGLCQLATRGRLSMAPGTMKLNMWPCALIKNSRQDIDSGQKEPRVRAVGGTGHGQNVGKAMAPFVGGSSGHAGVAAGRTQAVGGVALR
jgi:hypothetical protein